MPISCDESDQTMQSILFLTKAFLIHIRVRQMLKNFVSMNTTTLLLIAVCMFKDTNKKSL